jgi:predicted phage tail protein
MVIVGLWHPIFSSVFVPIVQAVADAFGTTAAQVGRSVAVALDIVGGVLLGALVGAVLALAYRTVRAPWLAFAACFVTAWLLAAASQDFLLGGFAQLISPLLLSFIVASGIVYLGALPRPARKHVP